ncbi:uncharacterized protein LOC127836201 [Dreissena polymorpha]|uniref:Uncharacterized protein n=1 Tax=Dreissena polymorpha TaxID=45954 RepID=A0A9D4FYP9_DREPO|nr:uncharacterized protein LOC127836201 [Dreissena polymorpha]KAH3804347.1 hypothetical protein DPMN_132631 [Dreissena polymorpha]
MMVTLTNAIKRRRASHVAITPNNQDIFLQITMYVRMMKALVIVVLACVGNCAANLQAADDTGVNGKAFKTSRIKLGDEELFTVTAADGTPLATIDVVRDEGYEIELTPDGRKCRISQVQEKSSCFQEAPLTDDEPVFARISDRCKGREIVTLKPKDCNEKSSLEKEESTRVKRHSCKTTGTREECGWEWWFRWVCNTKPVDIWYNC